VKSLLKISLSIVLAFLFVITLNTSLFAAESLKAPLVDIPEWKGEEVQAMDMDMNGIKIMNAIRSYEKDDSTFDAAIMVTTLQMGLAPFQQMNMSQGGIKIETTSMNGFKVMHTHDGNENEGAIMILLGETKTNSALFSLNYEGLSGEESIAVAKKFDWKSIQKAAKALMK